MNDILQKIQELLADFGLKSFFDKSNSVLGVDIGSSAIKLVQLQKVNGKAVLQTYGEVALGPYAKLEIGQSTNLPVEKISEALADVLRESNVSTKNGAFSIPLSSSLTTLIQMPHLGDKELNEMVPLEARKYIPVPISEVTLDWWPIPKRAEHEIPTDLVGGVPANTAKNVDANSGTIDILIAAIHNETISKYKALAHTAALDISFLEIETFSAMRSSLGREMHPVMVLDLGAGSTKLSIVEAGIILKSHVFGRGSQDITLTLSKSLGISMLSAEQLKRDVGLKEQENKDVLDVMNLIVTSIFTEANTMLVNFEKRYDKTVRKVVLIGGGSLLKGIRELAEKNFDTEIEYGDPFSRVEAPAFLTDVLKQAGPEFAVAVGIAFRKLQELK